MTSLGSPGLSSQSVLGFSGRTDWDDNPGKPRQSVSGFSGRTGPKSSQSVSGFLGPFRPENPETDWDDKPGLPRVVIPIHFGFLLALFGPKSPKRTGMSSLGFPELSSQSISGFFGPFRPEKPETDWDDKPGRPRVVIPVRFGVFGRFSARKPQNGLG